jgi:hypothetical protein
MPYLDSKRAIGAGTSQSVTLALGASPGAAIFAIAVAANADSITLTAATLGGASIASSVQGPFVIDGNNVYIISHVTQLTGNQVLSWTGSGSANLLLFARADSGLNQVTPHKAITVQSNADYTNTAAEFALATEVGEVCIALYQENLGRTLSLTSGSSFVGGFSGTFGQAVEETATGASTTIGGNYTGGAVNRFSAACVLNPAGPAPVLSGATGVATGATTGSGSVSTDTANGTLYRLASTTAPTVAEVKAANLTTTVTASGAQAVTFTGLTTGQTYRAYYVHRSAAGVDSLLATSGTFVPTAATYTAVIGAGSPGGFAGDTGSGRRAAGVACTYVGFQVDGSNLPIANTAVTGSASLNGSGQLSVAGLPSAGPWHFFVLFGAAVGEGSAHDVVTAS